MLLQQYKYHEIGSGQVVVLHQHLQGEGRVNHTAEGEALIPVVRMG